MKCERQRLRDHVRQLVEQLAHELPPPRRDRPRQRRRMFARLVAGDLVERLRLGLDRARPRDAFAGAPPARSAARSGSRRCSTLHSPRNVISAVSSAITASCVTSSTSGCRRPSTLRTMRSIDRTTCPPASPRRRRSSVAARASGSSSSGRAGTRQEDDRARRPRSPAGQMLREPRHCGSTMAKWIPARQALDRLAATLLLGRVRPAQRSVGRDPGWRL